MKRTYLAALAVGLVGCASPKWQKAGTTDEQFYGEHNYCEQQAAYTYPTTVMAGTGYRNRYGQVVVPAMDFDANRNSRAQFLENCMRSRGYVYK